MDYFKNNGKFHKDKVVMIIGTAGDIGNAITRQLSHYNARLASVLNKMVS